MILVDTSVWIDHLRYNDARLVACLMRQQIVIHPFILGEIALGQIGNRDLILGDLKSLPFATVATDSDVMHMIDAQRLFGRGIGYVDAHLLASALITGRTTLWTQDKRLADVAKQLGVGDLES
jgi:predicted nucleic acid-binding protein